MESHLNSRVFLVTILAVVLSAILAGGIVYMVQDKQNTDTKTDLQAQINSLKTQVAAVPKASASPVATATPITTPTATPAATATPTTDPTNDWQTFSSKTQGISFKYPKDYLVEDKSNGDERSFSISNHAVSSVTLGSIPSDLISMKISYATVSPDAEEIQAKSLESDLLKKLPSIKKENIKTADGSTVTYYVYYSQQLEDYSLVNNSKRLAQILAYFTLSNGKTFLADINNYEFTPKLNDQKQIDFIIQVLKTVKKV